jgi:glycosyltransferase involved in cell wall biosynthesis
MLSVIICTYNRADILRRTIDSLMNQEGVEDENLWELLIVDNHSKDHTKEVIENFIANTKLTIRYIFEPQQGKSYALNTGIANSRGRVLAFTDDDVIVDKRWVASIMEAGTKYPHRAFGGRVLPLWPSFVPSWIQPVGPYAAPIVGSAIVSHGQLRNEIKDYAADTWVPIGANMFFRREVFEKYGGFRTDLGPKGEIYGPFEDSEMGHRLMSHGEKILYYPKALIYHPVSQNRLSQEFLLKHFWNVGFTDAKMEEDRQLSAMSRFKMMLRRLISLISTFAKYLLSIVGGEPAAKMHHKCMLYAQGACLYYLAQNRRV